MLFMKSCTDKQKYRTSTISLMHHQLHVSVHRVAWLVFVPERLQGIVKLLVQDAHVLLLWLHQATQVALRSLRFILKAT